VNSGSLRNSLDLGFVGLTCLAFFSTTCPAATHYVVPPETVGAAPAPPFTNWATAGTNLLEVVLVAQTNPEPRMVWVTNGTYSLTNKISLTNAIIVKSVTGWSNTVVNGNAPAFTNCAFSISMPAGQTGIVDGLTISNCWASGLELGSGSAVQDCLITDCKISGTYGGGIRALVNGSPITIRGSTVRRNQGAYGGGGISLGYGNWGTLIQDTLIEGNNSGGSVGGGGIYMNVSSATITNCTIRSNVGMVCGGGIYMGASSVSIVDSVILCNTSRYYGLYSYGGGIWSDTSSSLFARNCKIQGNVSADWYGGGIYATKGGTIRNCLITDNMATKDGGGIWCSNCVVENCTIVTNRAASGVGGGIYMTAAVGSVTGLNNVIYYNSASNAPNFTNALGNANLSYSCVFPEVAGTGNTTNPPKLISLAGGNYRLGVGSPCFNSGIYQAWMTDARDLDGIPRIRYGVVDMGAYEYHELLQGSMIMFR
jgi:hypothetical protein